MAKVAQGADTMQIIIPTYGRAHKQDTLQYFTPELKKRTTIIAHMDEVDALEKYGVDVCLCPVQGTGIQHVRQWILSDFSDQYICMVDDDLQFYTRKSSDAWNLRYCKPDEVEFLFNRMEGMLRDGLSHVGVSARQGNNNTFPHTEVENTRLCHIYGFNAHLVRDLGFRFDALPLMEDYHLFLTLLKNGHSNKSITDFAVGQPGSNTKGGCSTHRTPELQTYSANKLATLHDPFVKVVEKTNKTGWDGMKTRTDVICYWKKAFAAGRSV